MHDMSVKWPNGARCAVMLTFDFDAETHGRRATRTMSAAPAC